MLLQIVDSVAKEEIVVGSCAVGDLLENNNATFAAGGHKPMETHSSQCRGITVDGDDEDECEGRNKNGVDMFDMELKLHSPAGGESLIYKWPLVLGVGFLICISSDALIYNLLCFVATIQTTTI